MSAVPLKPIIVPRPKVDPRPELRVEQGNRVSTVPRAIAQAAVYSVLTLSVYFSSSLTGQVMVEKARREGIRAVERNKDAAKEVALLRDKVQAMTRSSAIDSWAEINHFVAPESMVAQTAPAIQLVRKHLRPDEGLVADNSEEMSSGSPAGQPSGDFGATNANATAEPAERDAKAAQ